MSTSMSANRRAQIVKGRGTVNATETVNKTGSKEVDSSAEDEAPRLIVVCEYNRLTAPGFRVALGDLREITVGRDPQRSLVRDGRVATLSIPDNGISRKHLAVRRQPAGWEVADLDSKNGIFVNGRHVRTAVLSDGDLIEAGGTLLMFREDGGSPDGDTDRDLDAEPDTPIAFRTVSSEFEHRVHQLARIARGDVAVLIHGETGTGKERMAHAVHDLSARPGPFIPINCGALPRNLVESELFGHKRGAYSGAHEDREGIVRRAHGGTLFLDEIAELPGESQVALLRVLQEGEVRPIGASDATKVDVRIVAATHQDIPARIADGRFRQDLYARLSGFEMSLPALRDRREDLGTLIASILPRVAAQPERISLHRLAARALFRYAWPLNIRELEQALRSADLLIDTGEIRLEHLPEAIRTYVPPGVSSMRPEERAFREHVIDLLRDHGGNIAAVGRAMGKAPVQVRRWCQRMQIDLSQFRS
jgi:sigma-54 dependent transcriptional regulator, acetoin dehydrogenase operon transcriptional activator AcoR